jgi:hypothetical protein
MCVDLDTQSCATAVFDGNVAVRLNRVPGSNTVEVVSYPSQFFSVTFRQAREPYTCILHLVSGECVPVDLACSEDWGDIQECFPDECRKWPALGWGNDSDGHTEIDFVTDQDGIIIPMDEFKRDVEDFMIHHEG